MRWSPPAVHDCWTGVRDATQYAGECPQKNIITGQVEGNEDCLYLNVWTPKIDPGARRPVMVFLPGGANVLGSADQKLILGNLYDGQALAEREDAVIVTTNYRLNALGFLAHQELDQEDPHGASGNYGLQDAIAALRWVQDNITALGGDPSRVLLFGESAGAFNTCVLIASPVAAGLFSAAIMESGACAAHSRADQEQAGVNFARKVGCFGSSGVMSCMRAQSATAIVAATDAFSVSLAGVDPTTGAAGAMPWSASVDGYVVPDVPLSLIQGGHYNKVPLIIGTNAQEAAIFLPDLVLDCGQYQSDITKVFGASAGLVLAQYPCKAFSSGQAAEIQVISDIYFTCPTRTAARTIAAAQSQQVYRYFFTHRDSGVLGLLGAFHSAELPFVFKSFTSEVYIPSQAEIALSEHIQDYWGALATGGNPNGGGGPAWPAYGQPGEQVLVLDDTIGTQGGVHTTQCNFWDSFFK